MEKIRHWDKNPVLVQQPWEVNYCLVFIATGTDIQWKDLDTGENSTNPQDGLQMFGVCFKGVNA